MVVDFIFQFRTDVQTMNASVNCLPFIVQYILHANNVSYSNTLPANRGLTFSAMNSASI